MGWTLNGTLPKHEISRVATTFSTGYHDLLAEQLKKWWSFESYASRCNVNGQPREDEEAIKLLEKATNLSEVRYEVVLLWLVDEKIPNNYYSAYTQLFSL